MPRQPASHGATPWWHGGGLEWVAEHDRTAQRKNIEQLWSWGYAAGWITLRQDQELEPTDDRRDVDDVFPEAGWLDIAC